MAKDPCDAVPGLWLHLAAGCDCESLRQAPSRCYSQPPQQPWLSMPRWIVSLATVMALMVPRRNKVFVQNLKRVLESG
jgi:hypothetical protein